MTEKMKLIGDCFERVAWELTQEIARLEERAADVEPRPYLLTLYHQCLRVTKGNDPQSVLPSR